MLKSAAAVADVASVFDPSFSTTCCSPPGSHEMVITAFGSPPVSVIVTSSPCVGGIGEIVRTGSGIAASPFGWCASDATARTTERRSFPMARVSTTALLLLSLLASCAGLPTPSGRPELKVRIAPAEAKARITTHYAGEGWQLREDDAHGVTIATEYDSKGRFLFGQGEWVTRFDLGTVEGGTQIAARCRREGTGGADDVSGSGQGRETQRVLERLFDDVRIDGPYVMRFRE